MLACTTAVQFRTSAILCTAAIIAFASAPASATVLIADDHGGPMGAYLQRYASIRDSGERVIIDGQCLSACTMVLAIVPSDKICLTPNATFGFHAAISSEEYRFPGASSAATRALLALYPEELRKLIVKKGGLSDKMIFLSADELSHIYSQCRSR
jgi:hypothetical protein